jgi:hypothetical protein
MTKPMKTLTLSAALAALFLSAGAFAGAPVIAPKIVKANVTIIHKNSHWPVKGLITFDACALKRCIAI